MWIVNRNTNTISVKVPGMDEPVSFEDNPRQVPAEIGELLIEECPSIEEYFSDT